MGPGVGAGYFSHCYDEVDEKRKLKKRMVYPGCVYSPSQQGGHGSQGIVTRPPQTGNREEWPLVLNLASPCSVQPEGAVHTHDRSSFLR